MGLSLPPPPPPPPQYPRYVTESASYIFVCCVVWFRLQATFLFVLSAFWYLVTFHFLLHIGDTNSCGLPVQVLLIFFKVYVLPSAYGPFLVKWQRITEHQVKTRRATLTNILAVHSQLCDCFISLINYIHGTVAALSSSSCFHGKLCNADHCKIS